MEKIFKLKEHNTNVKTEILAGITTFMTMAYILIVNPNILSATGMDKGALFTATAISSSYCDTGHGIFCKLSYCISFRHGIECIFCHYGSYKRKGYLGDRSDSCPYRRIDIYCTYPL